MNLSPNFAYYFFVIGCKGEKLNIEFILNEQEKEKPFSNLDIYEYSNKNEITLYIYNTSKKLESKIVNNKLINYISYIPNNNSTNFIAFKLKPLQNINFIEYLVELDTKEEKNNPALSLINILIIILIIVIFITSALFVIYIKKKFCHKTGITIIQKGAKREKLDKKINDIEYELKLISENQVFSSNF